MFKDPLLLGLVLVVLGYCYWLWRQQRQDKLTFSTTQLFTGIKITPKVRLVGLPLLLRMAALVILAVCLAGPQKVLDEVNTNVQGIDIVLALDISGSMLAEDFEINGQRLNRLEVVKNVVKDFINQRKSDRIGLVVFAGRAYTVCPLTNDYQWLLANLERVQMGMIEDGTAIGSGLASSVSRLEKSQAKSKVVILLTDGSHNAGDITPQQAALMAQALGVKVYTIGAGTKGLAPYPVMVFGRKMYQQAQVDIDENTLTMIAQTTNGAYFRATDTASLKDIYQQIDKLEKVEIKQQGYKQYEPLYGYGIGLILLLLLLDIILSNTILMRLPS